MDRNRTVAGLDVHKDSIYLCIMGHDEASTDLDGNFSINAKTGATLNISYVGYETAEVKVLRTWVQSSHVSAP